MEITKLIKGSKITVILGCETEEEIKSCKRYKDQVGSLIDFKIIESP